MKERISELYIKALNEDMPPSVFANEIWLLFHPSFPVYKGRCCGRCDGVNDLCFSDMTCEPHKELGCEISYGEI